MFVVDSVFIEPVVDGGFEVDVITEVAWPGGGDKEVLFFWDGVIDVEFFAGPFVVLADESEVEGAPYMIRGILLVSPAVWRSRENNIYSIN